MQDLEARAFVYLNIKLAQNKSFKHYSLEFSPRSKTPTPYCSIFIWCFTVRRWSNWSGRYKAFIAWRMSPFSFSNKRASCRLQYSINFTALLQHCAEAQGHSDSNDRKLIFTFFMASAMANGCWQSCCSVKITRGFWCSCSSRKVK